MNTNTLKQTIFLGIQQLPRDEQDATLHGILIEGYMFDVPMPANLDNFNNEDSTNWD